MVFCELCEGRGQKEVHKHNINFQRSNTQIYHIICQKYYLKYVIFSNILRGSSVVSKIGEQVSN